MAGVARLPAAARALVAATVAAGGACLALRLPALAGWRQPELLGWAALTAAVVISEQFQIQLRRGPDSVNFAVTDAIWTAGLLLAPPSVLTLSVAAGVSVGQSFRRWQPFKIAFNVGQFLVAVTAAEVVFGALGSPRPTEPEAWAVAALAMGAFQVLNSAAVDAVVALAQGRSFRQVALVPTGQWVGNIALGILAALIWATEPRALPLLLVPLGFVYCAYRAWLHTLQERDRMSEVARVADAISAARDLSRRVAVEPGVHGVSFVASTFNRMLDGLEGALERERLFIRAASHELRTPVTICRGHLEVLGPHPSAEELDETVALVVDELDRMTRIIADMTTLAGTEHPHFLRKEQVDVASFVSQVATKAHAFLDGRLRLGPVPRSAVASADPQRLTQALVNLLQNAKLHTPEGTAVELRVFEEERAWRFEVADQAGGVPGGQEETLFRPFVRGGAPGPGSGLGLAITRAIAEAHGGTAGVENRPHREATFWIRIPREGGGDADG